MHFKFAVTFIYLQNCLYLILNNNTNILICDSLPTADIRSFSVDTRVRDSPTADAIPLAFCLRRISLRTFGFVYQRFSTTRLQYIYSKGVLDLLLAIVAAKDVGCCVELFYQNFWLRWKNLAFYWKRWNISGNSHYHNFVSLCCLYVCPNRLSFLLIIVCIRSSFIGDLNCSWLPFLHWIIFRNFWPRWKNLAFYREIDKFWGIPMITFCIFFLSSTLHECPNRLNFLLIIVCIRSSFIISHWTSSFVAFIITYYTWTGHSGVILVYNNTFKHFLPVFYPDHSF